MNKITALLIDGTIGRLEAAGDIIGKICEVELQDENGNFIKVTGEVIEVLESEMIK